MADPRFSRCSLSALEAKSVMCTVNGSKDIISTLEKSNALAFEFWVAWISRYEDRNVAANAPNSVKMSTCARLHDANSFASGFFV